MRPRDSDSGSFATDLDFNPSLLWPSKFGYKRVRFLGVGSKLNRHSTFRFPAPASVIALAMLAGLLCGCSTTGGSPKQLGSSPESRPFLPPTNVITKRLFPSNDRQWRPEQSRLAWAEITGDQFTIRNIRNNHYVTEDQFVPRYYDRQIRLGQIQSVDYVVVPFPTQTNLAHTMLSFGIDDGSYVTVSAEVRKEIGEDYSVIKGLGREYELMYVVGDERDLVRLRAAHRQNDVYVYPTVATPTQSRQLFTNMMARANKLAAKPEFYNTITNNCTTAIRTHINELKPNRIANAWQVLLPGHSDRYAYDLGLLDQRIPFEDLKQACNVSQLANEFYDSPRFSSRIRMGRSVIDRIAARQDSMSSLVRGQGGQYLEGIELR